MIHLKNFNNFINESNGADEEVFTPIIDGKGPFLKTDKRLRTLLDKNNRYPFFKTKKECDDYCDYENELLFANSDR